MSYFAVALCRCILPHIRHRHAKVRCGAIETYSSCVQIPNREKRKGSGTDTIVELIGFREENVLSVCFLFFVSLFLNDDFFLFNSFLITFFQFKRYLSYHHHHHHQQQQLHFVRLLHFINLMYQLII